MATLFVRHKVADYAKWRKVYNDLDTERQTMSVTSHGVYQLDGEPNDVTVYHEFKTIDAAKAFAGSPRLREAMQAGGVQGVADIWFTNRN